MQTNANKRTFSRVQTQHKTCLMNSGFTITDGSASKDECCSVWEMQFSCWILPLTIHYHIHYHFHLFPFMSFKFKDLVAKQHTTTCTCHNRQHVNMLAYNKQVDTWLCVQLSEWVQFVNVWLCVNTPCVHMWPASRWAQWLCGCGECGLTVHCDVILNLESAILRTGL